MSSFISKSSPLKACTLSLDEIKKLYCRLKQSVEEAARVDVAAITQLEGTTDEDFKKFKDEVFSKYELSVVIRGSKGESLVERSENIFTSPNLPNKITNIYFDSSSIYQAKYNFMPPQWFSLNLDFSYPQLLDWENAISGPTPNDSLLRIQGNNKTWVAGVAEKINQTIENSKNNRGVLHRSFIYDFGLWFVGMPLAFYLTYLSDTLITRMFSNKNSFIIVAAYVYVFLLALFLYRVLFGYTKWAFPKMEITYGKNSSKKHRVF